MKARFPVHVIGPQVNAVELADGGLMLTLGSYLAPQQAIRLSAAELASLLPVLAGKVRPGDGVTPHYEAGLGIRPPRKGGKLRGVAREVVDGGDMEVWACDHDHAPGVRDCRKLAPGQAAAAIDCAEAWLLDRVAAGGLQALPVTRDSEYDAE